MLHTVQIKDHMLRYPVTVGSDDSIFHATSEILAHKISGVLVVDENNNLVGMLSELDCLRSIINNVYNDGALATGVVHEAMTRNVEVNKPHEGIVDVAMSMLDHKHRRRPIIEEGKVVGQITCRRILQAVNDIAGSNNR